MTKTVMVIGASGLVGSEICKLLAIDPDYKVLALVRKPLPIATQNIEQLIYNFDLMPNFTFKIDQVYCAIGTTLKQAGSKENQKKIDCEMPMLLAEKMKKAGAKRFMLVSSMGANANSSNFYLRTKGQLEEGLKKMSFDQLVIARPGMLVGQRSQPRFAERIGNAILNFLKPIMTGALKKYRNVAAAQVAKALYQTSKNPNSGVFILENDQLV
jgi:uncharacterized protein YbjT (DUF2867 family)